MTVLPESVEIALDELRERGVADDVLDEWVDEWRRGLRDEHLHERPEPESERWSRFRDATTTEVEWIVEGLWPRGAFGFIAGPPGARKSWFGLATAVSVAAGKPLLGRFAVPWPTRV